MWRSPPPARFASGRGSRASVRPSGAHNATTPKRQYAEEGLKLMRYVGKGRLARGALVAAAAVAFAGFGQPFGPAEGWLPGAWAAEGNTHLDQAKTYLSKGNFSAAEIELRNAERDAP